MGGGYVLWEVINLLGERGLQYWMFRMSMPTCLSLSLSLSLCLSLSIANYKDEIS